MTLGSAFLIIGVVLLLVISFAIYVTYCHSDSIRLLRYEYWSDRFFSATKALVENDETPQDIIDLIETMNALITDKRAGLSIYRVYSRKLNGEMRVTSKAPPDDSLRAFCTKYPEMISCIDEVLHSGLLAITYTSQIYGAQARAVLADIFSLGSASNVAWRGIKEINPQNSRLSSLVPIIGRG